MLVGALGLGLIVAGVFVTDAGAGFPPGAPAGKPDQIGWHGILHEVGFIVALLSWTAACLVFVRRFAALRQWRWVGAAAVTVVAVLLLASAIQLGLVAALAARLMRGLPDAPAPSAA